MAQAIDVTVNQTGKFNDLSTPTVRQITGVNISEVTADGTGSMIKYDEGDGDIVYLRVDETPAAILAARNA